MELLTLKKVDNGWTLTWDDPEFEHPVVLVKEGIDSLSDGLIDRFVDTFMLYEPYERLDDLSIFDDREYQVQINVARIKPKKKDV